jgi:hypothetical protein
MPTAVAMVPTVTAREPTGPATRPDALTKLVHATHRRRHGSG